MARVLQFVGEDVTAHGEGADCKGGAGTFPESGSGYSKQQTEIVC